MTAVEPARRKLAQEPACRQRQGHPHAGSARDEATVWNNSPNAGVVRTCNLHVVSVRSDAWLSSYSMISRRLFVLYGSPFFPSHLPFSVVPVDDYPTLETILVVAGEALGKKLIQDWSGHVMLCNMYGPTEATVDCTSCHVTGSALTGVIGRPLLNCRIYILDKQHPLVSTANCT